MKTYMARKETLEARKWYLVDAEDKVLGRLASRVATILQGKHKPTYTPHVDTGDGIIVINAEKIKVTGKKMQAKLYKRFSGYPGGLKEENLETVMKKQPAKVIRHAVRGMLSSNRLRKGMLKRLKVYKESEHPHAAQRPERLEI